MKVLVACEYSATVRDAFRARGHDAWSCDLLPTEGDQRWHIQANILATRPRAELVEWGDVGPPILEMCWDLLIAHPPCTHLSVSGARHFAAKQASGVQQEALAFVHAGRIFLATRRARDANRAHQFLARKDGLPRNAWHAGYAKAVKCRLMHLKKPC